MQRWELCIKCRSSLTALYRSLSWAGLHRVQKKVNARKRIFSKGQHQRQDTHYCQKLLLIHTMPKTVIEWWNGLPLLYSTFIWSLFHVKKTNWLTLWLVDWLPDWLVGWLKQQRQLTGWRLTGRMVGRLTHWLTGLACWGIGWIIGILTGWLVKLLTIWIVGWLGGWLLDRLTDLCEAYWKDLTDADTW